MPHPLAHLEALQLLPRQRRLGQVLLLALVVALETPIRVEDLVRWLKQPQHQVDSDLSQTPPHRSLVLVSRLLLDPQALEEALVDESNGVDVYHVLAKSYHSSIIISTQKK